MGARTHLATLRDWKQQGRTRYLGITHYVSSAYSEVAKLLRTEKLDFVQINYSLLEREAEKEILPLTQDRGVAVIVNRPFGGGDLFARVRQKPLPNWAAEFDCHSWAQFLLKWIVAHPAVTCAIPATSNVRHLEDNMQAGVGRLPDSNLRRRMADAVANLEPKLYPCRKRKTCGGVVATPPPPVRVTHPKVGHLDEPASRRERRGHFPRRGRRSSHYE